MRQADFTKSCTIQRADRKRKLLRLAIIADFSLSLKLRIPRQLRNMRHDLQNINLRKLTISTTVFNLNSYSGASSLRDFRFQIQEIPLSSAVIGWTSGVTKRPGYNCSPITATCLVLRRLSSLCRWAELECQFGMHASAMSEIFWEVIESFHENCAHLITEFRTDLLHPRAANFGHFVHEEGAPLENCVGFIDCTKVQMCRPGGIGLNQRSVYSGHKRFHCLIYQTITTPDGLIFHLYGPEEGRRHDLTLYRKSNMEALLETNLVIDGVQYCIYGDAAYMLRPWLQVAYPRGLATELQAEYNKRMSSVREAVEWSYKEVKLYFTTQDMKRKWKSREAPIALLYISSALLLNFKTCLGHEGQVGSRFRCSPPSFEEYVAPLQGASET